MLFMNVTITFCFTFIEVFQLEKLMKNLKKKQKRNVHTTIIGKLLFNLSNIGFEYQKLNLDGYMTLTELLLNMLSVFATNVFKFDMFCSSSKLLKTFTGHTGSVTSIDCSPFGDCQLICSGSEDKTVRVWNVETNKQIQLFNGHSNVVGCARFSPYHYHNNHRTVVCSSSYDKTIRFWDIKDNQQLQ
ncbi:hypothetical protein RFI_01995, partial [Reticulomyxa filosa]